MSRQYFFLYNMLLVAVLSLTQCKNEATTKETVSETVSTITEKSTEAKAQVADAADLVQETAKTAMDDAANAAQETTKEAVEKVKQANVKLTSSKITSEEVKKASKEVVKKTEKAVSEKKPEKKRAKKRAKAQFSKTLYSFGEIKQGEVIKHDFKFKNIGDAPLVIQKVDVSCGCTFPSYPFIPIEPGKEGTIAVTYDSKNKMGHQKPTITVVTNGRPHTFKLNLEGTVQ